MGIFNTPISDARLVAAVLAGDELAFQEIVRRYSAMVHALALARLKDHEAAEDLAQEVFLRVYLHIAKLTEPRYLGTWIGRITRNLAEDWRRKNQRTSQFLPTLMMNQADISMKEANLKPVPEQMDESKREEILNAAIRDLPTDQQEIVLLHFTQGWNYREIAEKLEKDPTTVSRTLKKTLEALREKVGAALDKPRIVQPRASTVRTAAIIAALSAISVEAKASLAAATEGVVSASSIPTSTTASTGIWATALQWFQMLSLGKKIAVVAVSAGTITGGTVMVEKAIVQAPAPPPLAAQASAHVASAPTGSQERWDVNAPGLEGPWTSSMKSEKLVILLRPANGQYAGELYNASRARGKLVVDQAVLNGSEVTITTAIGLAAFKGTRTAADTLEGTYVEKGRAFKDIVLKREGVTPLQPPVPPHKEMPIDSSKLDRFLGTYAANATAGMTITKDGNQLRCDFLLGEPPLRFFAETETRFFSKEVDSIIEFGVDEGGVVRTAIILETITDGRQTMRKLTGDQLHRFRGAIQRQPAPVGGVK
ncbi:sigma-70 family RNA polymerase sigma factor [Candidatus Sumerlaeota bacterium]|nr:sigma-70 family RNA polymerase sigma factor [Candidatus Sumerlaeota bacterium]